MMKKKNPIFLLLLTMLPFLVFSQKHDYVWILGNDESSNPNFGGTIIDFGKNPEEMVTEILATNFNVANTSFCDKEGDLLFYSNGIKVSNQHHEIMINGDSLNAGQNAFDNANIGYPHFRCLIPLFFSDDEETVHLIHQGKQYPTPGILGWNIELLYSKIDLSFNNNQGKLEEKNILKYGVFYLDQTTATKHANGRDWWIITPHYYESQYHTILLTPNGFQNEFIQDVGIKPDSSISQDGGGQNLFSSDGKLYIDNDPWNGIRIFDFDRCTGELTHRENIFSPSEIPHGVNAEISPNSQYLYISNYDHIAQFDLTANNIKASIDTVGTYDDFMFPSFAAGFTYNQLAPNGKIYYCAGGFNYLHVIHHPNLQGDACRVEQFGVELPFFNHTALPHFPNYRLGSIDGSPCDTLGIDNQPLAGFNYFILDSLTGQVLFTDNSFYEPTEWFWTFGDGSTSSDINPMHTYSQGGIYEVCLVVSNANSSDTICQMLEFGTSHTRDLNSEKTMLLRVSPNPTTGNFKVQFNKVEEMQDLNLGIFNSLGQLVFSSTLTRNFSHEIELQNFDAGLYFCQFSDKDKILQIEKLVVLKP